MQDEGVERRLAAILAADVVGYSRLMGDDEAGTHARLKALRKEFIEPEIAAHHGRIVKLTGDGALVEFGSAVDAVTCAVAVQNGIAERNADVAEAEQLWLRIGINIGDVIFEDGDIYGDGVNVAARLEGLAEPGGICIARNVHNQVKTKIPYGFEAMGEHNVKNIAEPVTVFRVIADPGPVAKAIGLKRAGTRKSRWVAAAAAAVVVIATGAVALSLQSWAPDVEPASVGRMAYPLPDKPSIAVLPLDNLSGDADQDHFVDAITDNIITELSRFSGLFVIARNSVFTYKGQPVKVQEVAEDLGVQYVLEGSVQRSAGQMRVTAQLIDALTGKHVWADRYDRDVSDVFAVQDEVTQEIVSRIGGYRGELAEALTKRAVRKGTSDLSAYETFLLGVDHKHRWTKEDNAIAVELFKKAIELDPHFARAYVGLAWTYFHQVWIGWGDAPAESIERGFQAARTALALDHSDAEAHWIMADLHLIARQYEEAVAEFERARALNPNNADILADWAYLMYLLGTPEEGIEPVKMAIRLNPHNPSWYEWNLGAALYLARRYDEAIAALKTAKELTQIYRLYLAASYAQLGHLEEARAEVAKALESDPDATVESVSDLEPFKNPSDRDHFREGMRKAGLPLCATEAHLAKYPDMTRLEQCEAERARS